jgi:hypothetical protein
VVRLKRRDREEECAKHPGKRKRRLGLRAKPESAVIFHAKTQRFRKDAEE